MLIGISLTLYLIIGYLWGKYSFIVLFKEDRHSHPIPFFFGMFWPISTLIAIIFIIGYKICLKLSFIDVAYTNHLRKLK